MPNEKYYEKNETTHIKLWATIKYLRVIIFQLSEIKHDSMESWYGKLQQMKMRWEWLPTRKYMVGKLEQ